MLLRFLGSFSHLQDLIDQVVTKVFFEKRMPIACDIVWKRTVGRIKDEERVELFMAIAAEVGTDAELGSFKATFMQVKRFRDSVAHSARIQAKGNDRLDVNRTLVRSWKDPELSATEVSRDELARVLRHCAWLDAQVVYVLSSEKLLKEARLGSTLMEVLKPTGRPDDWDGALYRSATGR